MTFFIALGLFVLTSPGWILKTEAHLPRFPDSISNALEINELKIDSDRIVGGEIATSNQFPYQVSLQRKTMSGSSHFCGGSLIDPSIVLTAGHCCAGQTANKIIVVAGTNSLNSGGEKHTVEKCVVNPDYDPSTIENDSCVCKLDKPATLGENIGLVKLAENEPQAPSSCIVSGWGTINEGAGSVSQVLRYVQVPIVSREECKERYGTGEITDSMICAGVVDGGKDSCQGDSGGPLVDESNCLVGIVSWGYGCARPGYPGVYSNVANLRSWILQTNKTLNPPSKTNKIKRKRDVLFYF